MTLVGSTVNAQRQNDGAWWLRLSSLGGAQAKNVKSAFIDGVIEGMWRGATIAEIKRHAGQPPPQDDAEVIAVQEVVQNIPHGQVLDGLDVFYKDFRNRNVSASLAVEIVLKEIGGSPQEEIDQLIRVGRSAAVMR